MDKRAVSAGDGRARGARRRATTDKGGGAREGGDVADVLQQFRIVFASVTRHFRWIEKECGITGVQLWALGEIAENDGIKVNDLARALYIHQSTASNLIDRLQNQGLVRRDRSAADQRVVRLFPTDEGLRLLKLAPKPFRGLLPDALAALPATSLTNLARHLDELLTAMKRKDRSGRSVPLSEI